MLLCCNVTKVWNILFYTCWAGRLETRQKSCVCKGRDICSAFVCFLGSFFCKLGLSSSIRSVHRVGRGRSV
jgi:hypothetical protein